jgi:hypothetical protein
VYGVGFGVSGFGVWGLGFGVRGLGLHLHGARDEVAKAKEGLSLGDPRALAAHIILQGLLWVCKCNGRNGRVVDVVEGFGLGYHVSQQLRGGVRWRRERNGSTPDLWGVRCG